MLLSFDGQEMALCQKKGRCGKLTSFFELSAIWKKEASLPHPIYQDWETF
jgi:hypothetical protein